MGKNPLNPLVLLVSRVQNQINNKKKTERKFKSIGTKEIKISGWSDQFVEGDIYNEAVKLNKENHLSLIDKADKGAPMQQWLVDKSQFELVNDSDILESKTEK